MNPYADIKKELINSLNTLEQMLGKAANIPGMTDHLFADWEKNCGLIRKQLSEEMIRIAVVGSIKSGKSTFVNAFVKGDYLKRGAGVVTSFVTKIRHGDSLRARLFFKSWDDVNTDINRAITMLPDLSVQYSESDFDIRRSGDRAMLEKALASLPPEQLISNGAVDANSVLLGSYLKGYDRVKDILASDDTDLIYRGDAFGEHRAFVANDPLSVYLEDIQLEITTDALDEYLEVADCQGSDSPNPHHLAMIQDYLNLTHLIVYVISSRTGLRQADIRFLSMIKQMGIMDNIVFVINCDFHEHDAMEDLQELILKVKEELSYLKPDPRVFAFSALLYLFRIEKERLIEKDRRRLEQWEMETALVSGSDGQREAFEGYLNRRLNRERYVLLLQNQMERLRLMASGMTHWIQVNQKMLTRDNDQIEEIANKIAAYRSSIDKISAMIQHALGGSLSKIKSSLRADVDHLFEQHSEGLLDTIFKFVRNYDVRVDHFGSELEQIGFNNAMYRVYQEFRQVMDMFMAETVNPRLVHFIREKEAQMVSELCGLADSYEVMIGDILSDFNQNLEQAGIPPVKHMTEKTVTPRIEAVKSIAGITLPPAVAAFRYNAKIKTEAVARLGFYAAVKILKQVLKKPVRSELERQKNALKDGGQRMKRETEKSIRAHMKDYRENIKFQYVFKLSDAFSQALKDAIVDRFQGYGDNLMKMVDGIRSRKLDRTRAAAVLEEMETTARDVENTIISLQSELKREGG